MHNAEPLDHTKQFRRAIYRCNGPEGNGNGCSAREILSVKAGTHTRLCAGCRRWSEYTCQK